MERAIFTEKKKSHPEVDEEIAKVKDVKAYSDFLKQCYPSIPPLAFSNNLDATHRLLTSTLAIDDWVQQVNVNVNASAKRVHKSVPGVLESLPRYIQDKITNTLQPMDDLQTQYYLPTLNLVLQREQPKIKEQLAKLSASE